MNELSLYFVAQCKEKQKQKIYQKKNRLDLIDFNNFFKNSGKQELNNKFVSCSYYSNITIPEFQWATNDMSKYQLKNYKR